MLNIEIDQMLVGSTLPNKTGHNRAFMFLLVNFHIDFIIQNVCRYLFSQGLDTAENEPIKLWLIQDE